MLLCTGPWPTGSLAPQQHCRKMCVRQRGPSVPDTLRGEIGECESLYECTVEVSEAVLAWGGFEMLTCTL